MRTVYLDNAATTWPKPQAVSEAISAFLQRGAANPGRGGHSLAVEAGRMVYECRHRIARLFNIADDSRVIFTGNATQALNLAIFGLLQPGDHCVTTSMEHNAVSRPLHYLSQQGVEVTVVKCDTQGRLSLHDLQQALRPNTRLLVMTHASNVCGTMLPVGDVCRLAHAHGALTLVDAAQTAGVYDIDVVRLGIDLLAVPGHKSLLGPTGTGALYISPTVELRPNVFGGTGSFSELLDMPAVLPDKHESGTHNTVGLAGLLASLDYIQTHSIEAIRAHEQALAEQAWQGLRSIPSVCTYGTGHGAPIVAFNVGDFGSTEIAYILDASYGIATRAGLHCAPWAHETLGTLSQGVVRVSPGPFTTSEEINYLLEAVEAIAQEMTAC